MALGQQGSHLFDLHDLLRRAAEKAEQRFAEGLAQDAQAGEGRDALRQVGVAAPGERVGQREPVGVEREVVPQGGFIRPGPAAPLQAIAGPTQLRQVPGPLAGPDIVSAVPPEGLSAVERLGEGGGRGAPADQRPPLRPGRLAHAQGAAGFSQR